MSFTFWHCGVLIGETEFEETRDRHKVGIFRPTSYGLQLFPRISGMLSAASELKEEMDARGVVSEAEAVERASEFIESTAAGQRIIDLGRALCDVELRDATGAPIEVASMAFSDLLELRTLCEQLGDERAIPEDDLLEPDAPRYLVSVTLGKAPVALPVMPTPTTADN